ncbi:MAG: HIT family protein [Candidatus Bathyarchaeota archaeon]|nr:HIT family protein [Candidatus Termiticorpusculum sp.]MCL2868490.1 HIT family protein [Candidatus Termiticorpusculum sp.]
MKFDADCIFCKIVQKQAPSSIIYEDEQVMAFLDIRPASEGHTLVISKEHYEGILDIPSGLLGRVHQVSKMVAVAAKQALNADGINVIQQNGRAANQEVFHIHVHVIPRHLGQKMKSLQEVQMVDYKQLELIADKLKSFI